MDPLISILMPTYNRDKYISNAIESIINQTFQEFELIIYDDGSTDNTSNIINAYKDKRIKYIKNKNNKGVAYARNYLLNEAKGKIACWQDSDDISNKFRLEIQYNTILDNINKVVVSNFIKFNPNKIDIAIRDSKLKPKKSETKIAHASAMFLLENAVPIKLELSMGGSDAEWLRNMTEKHGSYIRIPKALYYVLFHSNRIGNWKKNKNLNKQWFTRMEKYKNG